METFSALLAFVWEFTGHRWIPLTKASDGELSCFLWSVPEYTVWVNNPEAGDLRLYRTHYDVIIMITNGDVDVLFYTMLSRINAWMSNAIR